MNHDSKDIRLRTVSGDSQPSQQATAKLVPLFTHTATEIMDLPQAFFSRRRLLAGTLSSAAIVNLAAQESDSNEPIRNWTQLRTQWVFNPRLAYFDTARIAPSTRAMLVAEYRALESLHSDPLGFFREKYSATAMQSLCGSLARWLDCAADELCFTAGATQGLQQYAQQLSLQAGDEVIVHAQLPPSLLEFWSQQSRKLGLVVKSVDLPSPLLNSAQVVAAFENALGERTRVLMCSHVQALDGAILPVRELASLARSRNALSLIDGSLSLGALQFSLRDLGCDVYASSFAHWLNGPSAAGLLYLRRDLHAALTPQDISATPLYTYEWPHLAGLWPTGVMSAATQLQSLPLALRLQERLGRARIEARLLELQTYARLQVQTLPDLEFLTPNEAGMYLQLLSVRPVRSASQLANWLRTNDQVIVSGISNTTIDSRLANVLRIALNVYNSFDDIDRMVLGLRRALRT
jgi:selenocysteine lyase/cysteine desulfurase